MTGNEVYERFVRLAQAGIETDENSWDRPYIEDMVDSCRATAIQQVYQKNGKLIHQNWIQEIKPTYSEDMQEDPCFQRFEIPMFLSMDTSQNGFMYWTGGGNNCTGKWTTSRASLAGYQHNPVTAKENIGPFVYPYFDIYGHGIMVESLRAGGVFQYVFKLPTYNKQVDEYPITMDVLEIMEALFVQKLKVIFSQPLDVLPDTTEPIAAK